MADRRAAGRFDLAVVGAGIVGLATALAGARRGMRVVVIDRDAYRANGASIRNFGFITVTGQERGPMWRRARRSRDVWCDVAAAANIPILHTGLWMTARHPESVAVLDAFMETEMAAGCRLLSVSEARRRCPQLGAPDMIAVLESTVELRVESKDAIPRLAAWLADAHGVAFMRETAVHSVELPDVHTSRGTVCADRVVVCPGDDFNGLRQLIAFATQQADALQAADAAIGQPRIQTARCCHVRSRIGRYRGYADLDAAAPLKARLAVEQAEHLKHGVHLIVVQSADGSLVVGDSHHYAATPDPFSREEVDALILDEFVAALGIEPPPVLERWTGTYASAPDRSVLIDALDASIRIAIVTCGAGASTGFAIGEDVIASFFDPGAVA